MKDQSLLRHARDLIKDAKWHMVNQHYHRAGVMIELALDALNKYIEEDTRQEEGDQE